MPVEKLLDTSWHVGQDAMLISGPIGCGLDMVHIMFRVVHCISMGNDIGNAIGVAPAVKLEHSGLLVGGGWTFLGWTCCSS